MNSLPAPARALLFSPSLGVQSARRKYQTLAVVAHVLQNTQNLVISLCCFAEEGYEIYQELSCSWIATNICLVTFFVSVAVVVGGFLGDVRDLTQQDGWKTQDGRMTYKNVAQDRECTVSRNIFSSFCRPESSSRPVA